ncbi:acyl-CoA dehydrogenase [Christiangramia fulva]|uniref:Acyl-CoA dehydrogenase n=1 Tax=Christiangramia fulva TaxID=2126553 RepID=A0A2R3Z817_9FLAO|nr:acyl-CoA dehydrogenase [Christiangramia fulva]AVR46426.1 acyl-CoA dehydrogenase [Christiangramia fulva]
MNTQKLREKCFGIEEFTADILNWIQSENLWNIWVPKTYGGLEMNLSEGLQMLREVSKIDGSLGWTITLCSGANYFVGNLKEGTIKKIFNNPKATCLGGSGAIKGTAEKVGEKYRISGDWNYATGSHYLSHFTLNASIIENGVPLKNEDGSEKFLSFILPKDKITIISDWRAMGLKATLTNSFKVHDVLVGEEYSFEYDRFHQPQAIFQLPFRVFADLTLWVNYIGMAHHFHKEAKNLTKCNYLDMLMHELKIADKMLFNYAEELEAVISKKKPIGGNKIEEIHKSASNSVRNLSEAIIKIYPALGMRACSENQELNQVFRDYFTATQHHNFVNR